jgi:ferrochelatase
VKSAILLIGHGSVDDPADIPDFVKSIRRGRPTPPSIIEEVTHRWKAIGGSPLLRITQAQAAALEARVGLPVAVGMRLWKPWAKDVIAALAADGIERVISLPVAPFSVHVYNQTAREACAAAGIACVEAPPWGEEPALIAAFAEVVREARAGLGSRAEGAHVLFTAHSLPTRVIAAGDPYEGQVRATAARIARQLALGEEGAPRWSVAFQSQGMDGGDWLGPDLPTAFGEIAAAGARDVIVCAIGFLADHTEILWDLDVEAKAMAQAAGLGFVRAASLNDRARFVDALEAVARPLL